MRIKVWELNLDSRQNRDLPAVPRCVRLLLHGVAVPRLRVRLLAAPDRIGTPPDRCVDPARLGARPEGLPQDEDGFGRSSVMHSQHRQIPKHVFPPGIKHHKFDYCLYYHHGHHRMLLDVKPVQGKASKPAFPMNYQERRLKRWRYEENIFLLYFFTATTTNVGARFFNISWIYGRKVRENPDSFFFFSFFFLACVYF